jgi:pimeloyl-ACP methyl ester carboxylesterase
MRLRLALAVVALFLTVAAGGADAAEERIELATRQGVTQPIYLTKFAGPAAATLVLFTGGNGALPHYAPPDLHRGNFLTRSRNLFLDQGFNIAVVDLPSDAPNGLGGTRPSKAHQTDIAAIIAYLRRLAVPVWLVGTSMGTISATNGGTLQAGGPDGIVLTSSIISAGGKNSGRVADAGPEQVKVPTLFVHNRDDACRFCSYGEVPELMSRFTQAPRKELITFEGGATTRSDPCEALSRHGYIGLEPQVVAAIGNWIKAK